MVTRLTNAQRSGSDTATSTAVDILEYRHGWTGSGVRVA